MFQLNKISISFKPRHLNKIVFTYKILHSINHGCLTNVPITNDLKTTYAQNMLKLIVVFFIRGRWKMEILVLIVTNENKYCEIIATYIV